ncbi:hypothetical protein MKW98_006820 [Papaver atlanticum]|uniref:Uncharacterized protein n=1 Tax=Papaver atlanticum TaxID=357466 RepID=A0AAD4SUL5_9MAGN|nr:hypothetical protein MKW98_006820 [Papaver atlanticum]
MLSRMPGMNHMCQNDSNYVSSDQVFLRAVSVVSGKEVSSILVHTLSMFSNGFPEHPFQTSSIHIRLVKTGNENHLMEN